MFFAFSAFCALIMSLATMNYHGSVKRHAPEPERKVAVAEDASLKARGINLPGYNHDEVVGETGPEAAASEIGAR